MKKNCIIISASSDIGTSLCENWEKKGWNIYGTYRKKNENIRKLQKKNCKFFYCDLLDSTSIDLAVQDILDNIKTWDVLIFCPGTMEPIGSFEKVNFQTWKSGIEVNFLSQLRILHALLHARNNENNIPTILFFAGGGTNNAVTNYSSYTISKIALIKMCELLDTEITDSRFVIIGPGWVKTKIHEETIKAGKNNAKHSYTNTLQKLKNNDSVDMQRVVDCCNWVITTKSQGVNGRNFSVEYDNWGSRLLEEELERDLDMYKLRRYKNHI